MTPVWRKSSFSGTGGSQSDCVELACVLRNIAVRDSKNPQLGHFALRRSQFGALLRHAKSGELDGTWSKTV
ncbi:DUF397 domain-containing protein [Actinomadura atramentaria]|uniref:DUF397 domain-containing protein n=1 Tax=Actinomadura atramentaria TaxID=1990 RepID=UPI00037560A5|nr:DUF397 domain-containing protein [Actinomadura atramentaria]